MEKTLHRVIIDTNNELGKRNYVQGMVNGIIASAVLDNDNISYMTMLSSMLNMKEDDKYIIKVRCSETAFGKIKSILDEIYPNMCTYE